MTLNTISGYRRFIRRFRNSKLVEQARKGIEELKLELDIYTDEDEVVPNSPKTKEDAPKPENDNTFTDPRDGQKYPIGKMPDGRIWMLKNLNFDIGAGSWVYENNPAYEKEHGRLYTWEAAKKACPKGWRMASFEEWTKLISTFEPEGFDLYDGCENAAKALVKGGTSDFNATLGGMANIFVDGLFCNLGENGNYWTNTSDEDEDPAEDGEEPGAYNITFAEDIVEPTSLWISSGLYVRCIKEEENSSPGIQKSKKKILSSTPHIIKDPNLFTDPRDGQSYKTVKLKDGNIWMAQNLNFDVGEGCWFYDNDPKYEQEYGRLYTWEAALKACPEGWHVPSDEEWWTLAKVYGGVHNFDKHKDEGNAKISFDLLTKVGDSGFAALFGGYLDSERSFHNIENSGNYWSIDENLLDTAYCYSFNRIRSLFFRYNIYKTVGLSVRCAQN